MEVTPVSTAGSPAEPSVGRIGALHTILCFLCSINAQAAVVEQFLTENPEALLFEGTALLPEDAAMHILNAQLEECLMASSVKDSARMKNCARVRNLIQKGFIFFKERQRNRMYCVRSVVGESFSHLIDWETKIMAWRKAERQLREKMLEEAAAKNLSNCSSNGKSCWSCVLPSHETQNPIGRGMFQMGKEHAGLLNQITQGRQSQYEILKSAFAGVPRFHAKP